MKKKEEDSKWALLPSFLIILATLLPTTIGVFFFHSSHPQQGNPWGPSVTKPPDLPSPDFSPPENVTPPQENKTPKEEVLPELSNLSQIPTFLVNNTDKASKFGWRLKGLDYYTSNRFTTSKEASNNTNIESYAGDSGNNFQKVKAINLTSNISNFLTYLQKPRSTPPVDQLQLENGTSGEELHLYQLNVTDDLIAYGSIKRNRFNASYQTGTTRLNRSRIQSKSAKISDTKDDINSTLKRYFLQLPGGRSNYLANHPQVAEFKNSTRLDESKTVYSQVQAIGNMLTLNFTIRNATAPNDTDAVSWFLNEKGGVPNYFSYTLAVTLRALGIPSRIVVGYLGGIPKDGATYLSKANLSIWVEVYDAEIGWTPYCSYLSLLRQNFTNIINCGARLLMTATNTHESDGTKWVYYNETFTLSLSVRGEGLTPLDGETVWFYDYNVSNSIYFNQSELTFGTDGEDLIASVHTSFLRINNSSELTINEYGIHILASRLMRQVRAVEIALVQRSEIK